MPELLDQLSKQLDAQRAAIEKPISYYEGDHKLAFATAKFREAFGSLFHGFSDNWCQIVVDAPVERLKIEGFRVSGDANEDARLIWQRNHLDSGSVMAHTEAGKTGAAYLLVEPGSNPRITVEHPSQFTVLHAAGDRWTRRAALKQWHDEVDGHDYATVYLPDTIEKYRSKSTRKSGESARVTWEVREGGGANLLGVVPGIPLYNNPGVMAGGRSDLHTTYGLSDAINKEVADMLVASEFAAFQQRVLMGVEAPTLADGTPDPAYEIKASVSRLLVLEEPDARIGEFSASSLSNYTDAITLILQHLAAQTRTPPHYLLGEIVNASGDALKAAETGLTAKCKRKILDFSDPWEEAMALALGADPSEVESIWADPEYRTMGELTDSAVKLRAIGLPYEEIWRRLGYSPYEIKTFLAQTGLPDTPPPGASPTQAAGLVAPNQPPPATGS